MSRRSRAALNLARPRPVGGRLLRLLTLIAFVGLSSSLTGCGSPGPAKSYQQGWDRAVTSPGYDCNTVPAGIASPSDWGKGCTSAESYLGIHDTKGHYPTPTPTTYQGDP